MQADRKIFVCQQCQAECVVPEGQKRKKWCDECRVIRERERWREKAAARALPDGHPRKPRPKGSPRKPRTAEQRRGERERAAARQGRVLLTRDEYNAQVSRLAAERREEKRADAAEAHKAKRAADRIESAKHKPWLAPGLSSAERWRLRYKHDPVFNLRERVRSQVRDRRKCARHEKGLRGALTSMTSGGKIFDELGYTPAQLRASFERQFTRGMSWQKFSRGLIHIDHILPLSSFDLANDNEVRSAWSLANLRPMWANDNIKKGTRREVLC
ncbi:MULTISPECIES: hypothetical protein [unclassified Chelatococcus]|uniref:hypothetical protein n=1 Tax=unclassified Chelatococcus TaxID=2638111 RepID=UPI001BCCF3B9|nr:MULTISPECIES: hypothetical protein [unclassified Chelatococcus]MBS7737770.1 hypothetical protein [Chelatococcus sp. HY11]MCO5079226.1 hypothetical protein [Chelatococcus sp.]CAH1665775.1 hypothetical protein CHELA41_22720 [Hyphomicrobiales bacterium]CAH1681116.1 hypothetical protein CHELA20_52200 [Hyphomicrobiales bacterium]